MRVAFSWTRPDCWNARLGPVANKGVGGGLCWAEVLRDGRARGSGCLPIVRGFGERVWKISRWGPMSLFVLLETGGRDELYE